VLYRVPDGRMTGKDVEGVIVDLFNGTVTELPGCTEKTRSPGRE
jgi:hypothetical protein